MRTIKKSALAVFKNKKILMVRSFNNEHTFYFLGGGIEKDETAEDALHREVKEEISCNIDRDSLTFLGEFEAPAYGKENTLVNICLYTGKLIGEPTPSEEVVEIGHFDSNSDKQAFTAITEEIFTFLKAKNLIN